MLGVALAARAPRHGHVCLDLASVRRSVPAEVEGDADAVSAQTVEQLPWPHDIAAWRAVLAASSLVAEIGADGGSTDPAAPGRGVPLVLDGTRLYLERYRVYEDQVAAELQRRARAVVDGSAPVGSMPSRRPSGGVAGTAGRRRSWCPRPVVGHRRRSGHRQDHHGRGPPGPPARRGAVHPHRPVGADGQGRGADGREHRRPGLRAEIPFRRRLGRPGRSTRRCRGGDGAPAARRPTRRIVPSRPAQPAGPRRRHRRRDLDGVAPADGPPARRGATRRSPRPGRRSRPAGQRRGRVGARRHRRSCGRGCARR